ncbi:6-hydroxy-D-nicotine oxidase [Tolypocladium ophioglossoides CBS 100239]|uniref:6-hydroxy-D-nicotine oxidase n=1 Tax=Tolypocladium ophioglossoides (strain CBS 100239) TaxID=1163406 RepID=A0A0L0NJL9_TOLOC|nr:6-hydroxy-D-nicotine oxidase [Tolypocladium ophioglossoides CBS 100239]
MAPAILGTDGLSCPFVIPNHDTPLGDVLPRWSASHLSHPAIIVTPKTEDDVVSAIHLAKQNGFRLIPGGGGHGTFVPIDSETVYVDMKAFKSIELDKPSDIVRLGAGVLTGELLKSLAADGRYTTVSNSNAVGVVGSLLGGGTTSQNGLQGFMVDNVLSFRLITAEGKTVEASSSSAGEELALFHALCGAGHGLGVVTAATMKTYPIADLGLSEDKIWTRTLVFPPPALKDVAEAFVAVQHPAGPLNLQITFLRSPPGTPAAGSPIIILSATYYGPSADAEKAAAGLFDASLVQKAIKADTALLPLSRINDGLEPLNAHGGFKSMNAARLAALKPESISATFATWLQTTEKLPDAGRTAFVFHRFDPTKLQSNGATQQSKDKFVEGRDRGFTVMAVPWCYSPDSWGKLAAFVDEVLSICRRGDAGAARTLPNTMKLGADLGELFSDERVRELQRVKKTWDAEDVFWSPYAR